LPTASTRRIADPGRHLLDSAAHALTAPACRPSSPARGRRTARVGVAELLKADIAEVEAGDRRERREVGGPGVRTSMTMPP
jgi:hypothetical protein